MSVPVLIRAHDLYCAKIGDAATVPADRTVTPPAPEMVTTPAPLLRTVMTVPTGKATDAFVGIVRVEADALDRVTRT